MAATEQLDSFRTRLASMGVQQNSIESGGVYELPERLPGRRIVVAVVRHSGPGWECLVLASNSPRTHVGALHIFYGDELRRANKLHI